MANEVRTQKTQVWFSDPNASPTIIQMIPNVADVGEFGPQSDDIDVTNFESDAKEYLTGLPDNGEATLQINLDTTNAIHQRLIAEAGNGTRFNFIVLLSDGTLPPTVTNTGIVAPANRTSFKFLASIKSFRMSIKTNDAVRAPCALKLSGGITRTWKS